MSDSATPHPAGRTRPVQVRRHRRHVRATPPQAKVAEAGTEAQRTRPSMQAQLDPPRREDAGSLEQRPTPFLTLWAQKWHANQVFEDFRPQSMISSHIYKHIIIFCSLNSPNSWKPGRKLDWRAMAAPFSFSAQERAFGRGGDAIGAEQGRSEVGRRRVPGGRTAQAEGEPRLLHGRN